MAQLGAQRIGVVGTQQRRTGRHVVPTFGDSGGQV